MKFKVTAVSQTPGIDRIWETTPPGYYENLSVAIPKEFEGPGGGYSPEDFYAMALANCFIATFKVFAAKSRMSYSELLVEVEITIDLDDQKKYIIQKANFDINLIGVENRERAERLLQKVSQNCIILNSIKTEKLFNFHVNEMTKPALKV